MNTVSAGESHLFGFVLLLAAVFHEQEITETVSTVKKTATNGHSRVFLSSLMRDFRFQRATILILV